MEMIRIFFIFACVLGVSGGVYAQSNSSRSYNEQEEAAISQKAKKKLYPGGRDEDELKVQNQVVTPARKFAPQTEVKEESADE